MAYDPRRTGFTWYKSDRPGVYNPYNKQDQISRNTWYENITAADKRQSLIREITVSKVISLPLKVPERK